MGLLLERDVDINIYDWVRHPLLALGSCRVPGLLPVLRTQDRLIPKLHSVPSFFRGW